MNERRPSERGEPDRTISRRRVLGATAATVVGAGGLLASTVPARARTTDFGDVPVGDARTRTITTENPVGRSLSVTDLSIAGADAEAFSVVGGNAPFEVGPNESHTSRIRFAPTSTGEKSAKVTVDTSIGSSMTAGRLAGRGVENGAASASGGDGPSTDGSNGDGSNDEESSDSSSTDDSSSGDGSSSSDTETEAPSDDSSGGDSSSPDGGSASTDNDGDSGTDTESSAGVDESSSSSSSAGSIDSETESSSGAPSGDQSASDDAASTEGSEVTMRSSTNDSPAVDTPSARNDAGAALTEILDVNDDGVVNLRDFRTILDRLR